MKKSIVKTICISAVLFVCFAMGLFGVLSVAAPKTMADYYNKVGLTGLSLSCDDLYYSGSTDINDQFVMFNKSVSAGNYKLIKKYSKKLLDNVYIDEFNEYLNNLELNKINPYMQNEKGRIVKNYVNALYNTKQINTAADYAFSVLEASEVGANFITAVNGLNKSYNFSSTQKNVILSKYGEMLNYFKTEADGVNKGVVALRLSELLEVLLRFENSETYESDFNLIKLELKKWDPLFEE